MPRQWLRDKYGGMKTTLRFATADDISEILKLIQALAEFEKLSHEVTATEDLLKQNLFSERKMAETVLAEQDGRVVGFALFFHSFSTFLGKPGIYLEDLFVLPEMRSQGIGMMLLSKLAQVALERGCGRLEWSVLDWNQKAIDLYLSIGAKPMDEWTVMRLTQNEMQSLAVR